MKVKIELECRAIISFQLHGKIMQSSDLWEYKLIEFVELPIQIFTTETRSKIACNHSIWVKHGNHIEYKVLP